MKKCLVALVLAALAAAWPGHGRRYAVWGQADPAVWTAKEVRVVEGFNVPECVFPDIAGGAVYVSNIDAEEGAYWSNDRKGHIARLTPEGDVTDARWLDSGPAAPINSPKGMCRLGDYLYFTDNTRLMRVSLKESGAAPEEIRLPEARMLNDLASDGKCVYVSDTSLGRAYRVDEAGLATHFSAIPSVNGLTCHDGRVYAVSWDGHEVYELDPEGREPAKPFGLAKHFSNLDGIEALEDGSFLVSDFTGNKV